MRYSYLLIAGALVLSACGAPIVSDNQEGATSSAAAKEIRYDTYSSKLVGRGKPALLFFYKGSDPFSGKNDKLLKQLYSTDGNVLPTYKIDFNTSTGARLTYGVLVEDTFVLLNGKGERVDSFIHPSSADIRILLSGKVPSSPKK